MDERSVAEFWNAHPCGEAAVGVMDDDFRGFFDRYDAYRYVKEPHILKRLDAIDWRDKRVLEIGLGLGADSEQLIRRGARWSGVDLTQESVDPVATRLAVRGLPYESLEVASPRRSLPFDDDQFDLVFSHGVLHHIPDIDLAQREIARVLKRNGRLIAMLYAKMSLNYLFSIAVARTARCSHSSTPCVFVLEGSSAHICASPTRPASLSTSGSPPSSTATRRPAEPVLEGLRLRCYRTRLLVFSRPRGLEGVHARAAAAGGEVAAREVARLASLGDARARERSALIAMRPDPARRRRPAELRQDGAGRRRAHPRHARGTSGRRAHGPALRPGDVARSSSTSSALPRPDYDARRRVWRATAAQTARVLERIEQVLESERPQPSSSPATSTRRWPRRSPPRSSRSPSRTSRRGCGRSTARCRRRSTASSPTRSRPGASRTARRPSDNLLREGIPRRPHPLRRQHDDRHARPVARARPGRRTSTTARDRERAATSSSRCTGRASSTGRCSPETIAGCAELSRELPVVFPVHPRTRARLGEASFATRAASPHRPGGLPRLHRVARRRRSRAHRLGRGAGGDDVPRRSVLHAADDDRAARDDRAGNEPLARPRARRRSPRSRRAGRCPSRPQPPATLGRLSREAAGGDSRPRPGRTARCVTHSSGHDRRAR